MTNKHMAAMRAARRAGQPRRRHRPQVRVVERLLRLLTAELILKDIDLEGSRQRREYVIAQGERLIKRIEAWRQDQARRKDEQP